MEQTEIAVIKQDMDILKKASSRNTKIIDGNGTAGLITTSRMTAEAVKVTAKDVQEIKDDLKATRKLINGAIVGGIISIVVSIVAGLGMMLFNSML